MEFPFDNKPCRKMNEADKERYFREKVAYERITGQFFPVSKVFEEIVFNLVFFLVYQVIVTSNTSNALQDASGATR